MMMDLSLATSLVRTIVHLINTYGHEQISKGSIGVAVSLKRSTSPIFHIFMALVGVGSKNSFGASSDVFAYIVVIAVVFIALILADRLLGLHVILLPGHGGRPPLSVLLSRGRPSC